MPGHSIRAGSGRTRAPQAARQGVPAAAAQVSPAFSINCIITDFIALVFWFPAQVFSAGFPPGLPSPLPCPLVSPHFFSAAFHSSLVSSACIWVPSTRTACAVYVLCRSLSRLCPQTLASLPFRDPWGVAGRVREEVERSSELGRQVAALLPYDAAAVRVLMGRHGGGGAAAARQAVAAGLAACASAYRVLHPLSTAAR